MTAIRQPRLTAAAVLLFMTLLAGTACGPDSSSGNEVLVFAAISLTDAMEEVVSDYEGRHSAKVLVSYGGSQTLAQQIASGAPADMFISAGRFPMDFLEGRQVAMLNIADLLSNRLVLVAGKGGEGVDELRDLTSEEIDRVAIATPDLAPAGGYAKESLVNLGLWDDLQRKMVFGADVRATMAYVESGNADVAFVYQTDAAIAAGLEVIDVVPLESYSRIVYPVALLRAGDSPAAATAFFDFLAGEEASRIFADHGFGTLQGGN